MKTAPFHRSSSEMEYRILREADIEKVIPLYLEYYNNHEGAEWTKEKGFQADSSSLEL